MCLCKLIDNSDKWIGENPNETLVPEGFIYVTLNKTCPKHKNIYERLVSTGHHIDCSIELLRKLEYKNYLDQTFPEPQNTRLSLIRPMPKVIKTINGIPIM